MSFRQLLVHTVSIVRPGSTVDGYNNAAKDWSAPSTSSTEARMVQRTATEVLGDREASVTEWVAFLPGTVTVAEGDRIVWNSLTFEVAGEPRPAVRRTSVIHHVEAPLRRVRG